MALRWYSTVIESTDHRALAQWWADALRWDVVFATDAEAAVMPPWGRELFDRLRFEQVPPGLVFVPVERTKSAKNRLHLDFAPHTNTDREAEVSRLLDLGATHVDVGQPQDATWTVLADPEGNEFCILSSREM